MDKCPESFFNTLNNLEKLGGNHEVIPVDKIPQRFPGLRYGSNHKTLVDNEAGILSADACLLAVQVG